MDATGDIYDTAVTSLKFIREETNTLPIIIHLVKGLN